MVSHPIEALNATGTCLKRKQYEKEISLGEISKKYVEGYLLFVIFGV